MGSQPADHRSHKPEGRLPSLFAMPYVAFLATEQESSRDHQAAKSDAPGVRPPRATVTNSRAKSWTIGPKRLGTTDVHS